jgi:uncharacterized protein DUF6899
MPYIENSRRPALEPSGRPQSAGELNYAVTRLVDRYLSEKGLRYQHINEVIGVLECAKLELYRRIASPYEDKKKEEEGDVYRCLAS